MKAVLVDHRGTVLERWADHDPAPEARTVAAVLARISTAVAALDPGGLPIGVAVPGFFDTRESVVRSSPNFPEWVDVPLATLLEEALGSRVSVDNDANAAVLGEAWAGAATGLREVVMLTLGTGVGSGFLVNGRVLRGARGAAAEAGHMVIHPGGRPCGCGRRGCLETYASGPGLVRTAREMWEGEGRADAPNTATGLFALHAAQDPTAGRVVTRFASDLARGLTTLVHLFAPEAIVLGGGVSTSLQTYRGALETELSGGAIQACIVDALPVRAAALGSSSGAVGAARSAVLASCPEMGAGS